MRLTGATDLSPSLSRRNCSTKRQRKVGPTLAPSSGSSAIPPTHTSTLSWQKQRELKQCYVNQGSGSGSDKEMDGGVDRNDYWGDRRAVRASCGERGCRSRRWGRQRFQPRWADSSGGIRCNWGDRGHVRAGCSTPPDPGRWDAPAGRGSRSDSCSTAGPRIGPGSSSGSWSQSNNIKPGVHPSRILWRVKRKGPWGWDRSRPPPPPSTERRRRPGGGGGPWSAAGRRRWVGSGRAGWVRGPSAAPRWQTRWIWKPGWQDRNLGRDPERPSRPLRRYAGASGRN